MSTFDAKQTSTAESRPVELYTFEIGSTPFHYTTSEDAHTIGTTTWTPVAGLRRSRILDASTKTARALDISMPAGNALISALSGIPPDQTTAVTVFKFQRDQATPSTNLIYQGVVSTVTYGQNNRVATVKAVTEESAFSLSIPSIAYSAMCNNFLGDSNCGVDLTKHGFVGVVSAVNSLVITVPGASAATNEFGLANDYVNGFVRLQSTLTDFRLIIDQNGDDLTLLLPFRNDVTGQDVFVTAGCNRVINGDCALVFNNVSRAIGFPFTPTKDIHRTGI